MQHEAKELSPVEPPVGIGQTIGRRIKEARKALRLNLDELAPRIGLSIGQLSKIENGKAVASIQSLVKLGGALQRPVGYFLQADSDMPRCLGTLVPAWDTEARALKRFAELVTDATTGGLSIAVFSASQLGSATGQVEALMTGLIDIFVENLSFFGDYAEAARPVSLPFCFETEAHQEAFARSDLFEREIRNVLRKSQIELLPLTWRRGPTLVIVGREPAWSPSDLRGRKVRSSESEVLIKYLEAFGATPVVVPWARVYEAFEAGEFDTMITNLSHVVSMRFTRIAKFVSLLNYRPLDLTFAVNLQRNRMLAPSFQNTVREALVTAGQYCAQLLEEAANEVDDLSETDGAIFSRIPNTSWRERSQAVIAEIEEKGYWRKGLLQEIRALSS